MSKIFEILYSKFWAATVLPRGVCYSGTALELERDVPNGFNNPIQFFPLYAAISPQAPPTFEFKSNVFQRQYILFVDGLVPTSMSTQMLG